MTRWLNISNFDDLRKSQFFNLFHFEFWLSTCKFFHISNKLVSFNDYIHSNAFYFLFIKFENWYVSFQNTLSIRYMYLYFMFMFFLSSKFYTFSSNFVSFSRYKFDCFSVSWKILKIANDELYQMLRCCYIFFFVYMYCTFN